MRAETPPQPLIPGLPDEVAELCLLRLPFASLRAARSVSSSWKRVLSDHSFHLARSSFHPYVFVAAFPRRNAESPVVWLAFDPVRRLWLPPLPPMPISTVSPSSFSSAILAGNLFVVQGQSQTFTRFHPHTNRWTLAAPMPTPRAFPVLASVSGRILAVGGGAAPESYDPKLDSWTTVDSGCGAGIEDPYDAAVSGDRMYVTEGWRWPFDRAPRGEVYGGEGATTMGEGMRKGWTGASAVVGGRVMVVEEWGEGRVKVYQWEDDTWIGAEGGGVPRGVGKPVAVCGGEGAVLVVGQGMAVATGAVREVEGGSGWKVEGPPAWRDLCPVRCHVIYV